MISADSFVLEKSFNPQIEEFYFENKQIKEINDINMGAYINGVVTFDLNALRNMDSVADFSNSFFIYL